MKKPRTRKSKPAIEAPPASPAVLQAPVPAIPEVTVDEFVMPEALAHMDRPAFRTALEGGSRARVLELAGFDYIDDVARALAKTRRALKAVRPERVRTRTMPDGEVETTVEAGGAPDWPIRLEATKQVYMLAGLTDPARRQDAEAQSGRPVAVNITVQQPAVQPGDVAVRVAMHG